MTNTEIKPWVLVSNIRKDTTALDIQMIVPQVTKLVDGWQSQGKIMWSGAFDNEQSSMAVFEATEEEANEFFKQYDKICSGVLNYYLHKWDAMPILSVLSK